MSVENFLAGTSLLNASIKDRRKRTDAAKSAVVNQQIGNEFLSTASGQTATGRMIGQGLVGGTLDLKDSLKVS